MKLLCIAVDLDRLNDDVKRYSCTPRNYSVNLREELKLTNVVFFPRCLLVQRCGGNCGCGTPNWKSCTCVSGKTVKKYHEVFSFFLCYYFWVFIASMDSEVFSQSCVYCLLRDYACMRKGCWQYLCVSYLRRSWRELLPPLSATTVNFENHLS